MSLWLITNRTHPAWDAIWRLLNDGHWHPRTEVVELMHQTGLAPRTIDNHLRSASRRGWITQSRGRVKVRDSHAIDAALSAHEQEQVRHGS